MVKIVHGYLNASPVAIFLIPIVAFSHLEIGPKRATHFGF